ncbi:AAA family ATPase [Marmoricola sp. RAF53]|uniref:AAA family ATPase n=1 Tax=Marmoricola sp. RAF53 TaxID=3233059 RepID=UPI003F9E6271
MARSDLLKRLFAAYSRSDDASFREAAARIIAEEQRLGHRLLAADLEHALTRDAGPATDSALSMRPLPKSRDDRPLLALTKPHHDLDDLVLDAVNRAVVLELVEENRSRSLLAGFRLLPRRRLLFIGDPGTGKSATAHAIASELSLPVATVSLAALTSSYLGETARNVESIVRFAELTPCVLVFDEFDAIATERSSGSDHAEIRRVLATILQLIEAVQGESVVVATSNHPQMLDSAMWRRFDEVVRFEALGANDRERLIALKLRGAHHRLNTRAWATELKDVSPADIELICLDAQRRWVLSGKKMLTSSDFQGAFDRYSVREQALRAR